MDIIKVCPHCKGDGFWRADPSTVHPFDNVAYATKVYSDGTRVAIGAGGCGGAGMPIAYEFKCSECRETGEIIWRRGISLVPDCA